MLEAPVATQGKIPVGVVSVYIQGEWNMPHVQWFPWSSDRNKLEAAVAFIDGMRRTREVVITANAVDAPFFDKLHSRYNLIRPVGRLLNGYGAGQPAMLYEALMTGV